MKGWALSLAIGAASAAAVVVASMALRRAADRRQRDEVPQIIEDCFHRIDRIQQELQRLRSLAEPAA